ncbi:hypothetical protein OF001_U290019 [Pseudomonas sp. OF001]|nr:hypothetical protein OF001_U290019 [Pseudomonas sp. OF001]
MTHQQRVLQVDLLRHRQVDHMAVARRHRGALALLVEHMLEAEVEVALRAHQLEQVADLEAVLHRHLGQAVLAHPGELADELLALGQRVAVLVVLVFVVHVAAQEALGVAAVGQRFQGVHQRHVERPPGHRVVDRLAVHLGGARHVVVALGAALDLQRVHAHLGQALDVLHGAQVLGVHDVGAVLVLERFHVLAGTVAFFQQHHLVGGRAGAEGRLDRRRSGARRSGARIDLHHRDRLVDVDDVAQLVLLALVHLVLPAAGVGAGTLVGVAVVEVAGQQAAPGVGHAQRAVDEHLQLDGRHLLADLGDLLQRQLAGEDDAADADAPPELHRGPVHRVGLHRQVDRLRGEVVAHQHDQPRVGHDQRVRPHRHHRLEVPDEGLQLGVVRGDVDHHVELLAQRVGLVDAQLEVGVVELVVAHPQAVARLPGVHRVGAVGEGVAHAFQRAGGGEQFGTEGGGHGAADSQGVGKTQHFTVDCRRMRARPPAARRARPCPGARRCLESRPSTAWSETQDAQTGQTETGPQETRQPPAATGDRPAGGAGRGLPDPAAGPGQLPGSQADRPRHPRRAGADLLLRLRLPGQPRRPGQLRLPPAQERPARRAHRVGARGAGLGDRPPAPVLAAGRARPLQRKGPGVRPRRGRPAQPGAGHRRGQRRPQQLPVHRPAVRQSRAIRPVRDGDRLPQPPGHAPRGDSRRHRAHLPVHARALPAAPVQAGPPALRGLAPPAPGQRGRAQAQPGDRLQDGLGQSVRRRSGAVALRLRPSRRGGRQRARHRRLAGRGGSPALSTARAGCPRAPFAV